MWLKKTLKKQPLQNKSKKMFIQNLEEKGGVESILGRRWLRASESGNPQNWPRFYYSFLIQFIFDLIMLLRSPTAIPLSEIG